MAAESLVSKVIHLMAVFLPLLLCQQQYVELTWFEFLHAFRQKYEVPETRATLLLDKLNALKYEVVHDMPDYCKRFRHYETQIYEMAFTDRLDYFREDSLTSGDAYSAHKDMEVIYQLAGQEPTGETNLSSNSAINALAEARSLRQQQ